MRDLIYIGDWGIGVTDDSRVYLEYQKMDCTIHNAHDIRLYIDGNFASVEQKIIYAKIIVDVLIKGEKPNGTL